MANYRRLYVPGGTVFLTVVTHERRPLFKDPRNIERLRQAATTVMAAMPFAFEAAVVLHDHFHVLWTMPEGIQALKSGSLGEHTCGNGRAHGDGAIWQPPDWWRSIGEYAGE